MENDRRGRWRITANIGHLVGTAHLYGLAALRVLEQRLIGGPGVTFRDSLVLS